MYPDFLTGRPTNYQLQKRQQPTVERPRRTTDKKTDRSFRRSILSAGGGNIPVVDSIKLERFKITPSKTTTTNNIPFPKAHSNLMQQLSTTLWKYNSRIC